MPLVRRGDFDVLDALLDRFLNEFLAGVEADDLGEGAAEDCCAVFIGDGAVDVLVDASSLLRKVPSACG